MMPLSMVNTGEENTIKKVGGKEETRRFLEGLGFVTGGKVKVVSEINGSLIVNVKDSRVAIGRDMAKEWAMKTLREIPCGQTVKVQKLNGGGPVKRRIMDMGITRGIEIFVRKVAPLGDPIEVTVRGYELSLRKADAEMIEVE